MDDLPFEGFVWDDIAEMELRFVLLIQEEEKNRNQGSLWDRIMKARADFRRDFGIEDGDE